MRVRSNSYDTPHQQGAPNASAAGAALVQLIPTSEQVDGLEPVPPVLHHVRHDSITSTSAAAPYSNASFNVSAPVLNYSPPFLAASGRSATSPAVLKKSCSFASNLSVHTTWPALVYDRRAEPATCNRLTPALAQKIKEELNAYKMEEMEVHHSSRIFTHFLFIVSHSSFGILINTDTLAQDRCGQCLTFRQTFCLISDDETEGEWAPSGWSGDLPRVF